ncbi:MAG: ABC transporter permease subunit [Caldilineaceae bacterium]
MAYLIMLISIPVLWLLAVHFSGFPSFCCRRRTWWARCCGRNVNSSSRTWTTIVEALTGYAIANLIAISLSIAFLYIPWLESLTVPWTVVIKNIPFVTIASILIITLGDTPAPKIIIVVLITFFPILANVTKGLQSVDPVLLDRMQTLNANQWQIFSKVRWPSQAALLHRRPRDRLHRQHHRRHRGRMALRPPRPGLPIVQAMTQYRADRLLRCQIPIPASSPWALHPGEGDRAVVPLAKTQLICD